MISTETYPIREAKSAACGSDNPVRVPAACGSDNPVRVPDPSTADLQALLTRREAQIRSLCLWLEAQRKELDYLIAQLKECC